MEARLCPRCFDDPQLQEEFARRAMDYALELPPEQCVEEGVYQARLTACEKCEYLAKGACGKCGCFVIVRARRKNKDCPLFPSRWI